MSRHKKNPFVIARKSNLYSSTLTFFTLKFF
jgi:hypothetical protein